MVYKHAISTVVPARPVNHHHAATGTAERPQEKIEE